MTISCRFERISWSMLLRNPRISSSVCWATTSYARFAAFGEILLVVLVGEHQRVKSRAFGSSG